MLYTYSYKKLPFWVQFSALTSINNWEASPRPLGINCCKLKTIRRGKRQNRFDNVFIFNLVDGACAVNNSLNGRNYKKVQKILSLGMYCLHILNCNTRHLQSISTKDHKETMLNTVSKFNLEDLVCKVNRSA